MWAQLTDWVGDWQLITALVLIVLGFIGLMIVADILGALIFWTLAIGLVVMSGSSSGVSREGFEQLVNDYAALSSPCPDTAQKAKDLVRIASEMGRIPNHSFKALQASVQACAASEELQAFGRSVEAKALDTAERTKASPIVRELREWAEQILGKTVSAQGSAS